MTAETHDPNRPFTIADLPGDFRTLSARQIMALVRRGKFPKPFKLRGHGTHFWLQSDIDAFIASRAAERMT
ncbi:MAG: hypothetical protein JWP35_2531 [Caulobacter sp.]|nr:hypothetical protein [Caulobacter sp.]